MFSCLYSVQTSLPFLPTVPEIPPSEVSGGGGSRSELVITWDVSLLGTAFLYRNFFLSFLSALSECPWLQHLLPWAVCDVSPAHWPWSFTPTVPVLDGNPLGVQIGWDCCSSQTNINAEKEAGGQGKRDGQAKELGFAVQICSSCFPTIKSGC